MRHTTRRNLLRAWAGAHAALMAEAAGEPSQVTVFRSGDDGYHTFRIPALLETRRGSLLAFCEGRRNSSSDSGDIDLVLKRSQDGGATWSALQVVADLGANTIGNPCPVQDRKTGRILLPLTYNPGAVVERQIIERTVEARRTVYLTHSSDDGRSWATPREITSTVTQPDWTWYATGPGTGIQMRSGRIIIPCDHVVEGTRGHYSHIIYSDDGGQNWRLGGSTAGGTNECQAVELPGGELLLNMRNAGKRNHRVISRSRDGGLTWSELEWDQALVEPVCQASLIRVGKQLFFSNPASTRREKMTVKVSSDWGRTWQGERLLHGGPAAYSSLAPVGRRDLGCLYESGEKGPYERIVFARFSRKWVNS